MRRVRKITAEEENFRLEQKAASSLNVVKRDPVEPEPVGTIVLLPFIVTGYDPDCDGSLMVRLDNIDMNGEITGWSQTNIGIAHDDALVVTSPELKSLFEVLEDSQTQPPSVDCIEEIVKKDIDEHTDNVKNEDYEEDFEKKYPHIYKRYKRKVISHPEGAIVHDGDCRIYSVIHICSCGLHHDLQIYPTEAEKIYPKYWEELKGIDDMEELVRTHSEEDN